MSVEAIGYIDIDDRARPGEQYRYWCPEHVPDVFREPWREIDEEEAVDGEVVCMVCRRTLATPPDEEDSPTWLM